MTLNFIKNQSSSQFVSIPSFLKKRIKKDLFYAWFNLSLSKNNKKLVRETLKSASQNFMNANEISK
jgi:hypothetical protein